jgi:hypothetical protein
MSGGGDGGMVNAQYSTRCSRNQYIPKTCFASTSRNNIINGDNLQINIYFFLPSLHDLNEIFLFSSCFFLMSFYHPWGSHNIMIQEKDKDVTLFCI